MTGLTPAAAIIPVRVESQRLPRKALLAESGKPLFLHTFERTAQATTFARVCIATDSDEVAAAAAAAGAPVLRTSARPRTGSERCAEAAAELDGGIFVDVQGDWPEIEPDDLDRLTRALRDGDADCATLAVPLRDPGKLRDPNVVKVVRGLNGDALYFSRAPIPHGAGDGALVPLRHVGVYAFTREVLLRIPQLPSSGLAETESLEQLRFLENGIRIRVLDGRGDPWAIETRRDYDDYLQRLSQRESTGA